MLDGNVIDVAVTVQPLNATNEKKEIEDPREKGMDSRDHGRACVKSI